MAKQAGQIRKIWRKPATRATPRSSPGRSTALPARGRRVSLSSSTLSRLSWRAQRRMGEQDEILRASGKRREEGGLQTSEQAPTLRRTGWSTISRTLRRRLRTERRQRRKKVGKRRTMTGTRSRSMTSPSRAMGSESGKALS